MPVDEITFMYFIYQNEMGMKNSFAVKDNLKHYRHSRNY